MESRRAPTGQRRPAGRAGESRSGETGEACAAWRADETTGRQAYQASRAVPSGDTERPGEVCTGSIPPQAGPQGPSQDGASHQVSMKSRIVGIKFL
jgi:hypothetical protein